MIIKSFTKSFALTLFGLAIFAVVGVTSINAHAAMVPSLSLSLINNNTQVQMTVIGANPNAPVMFYYPSTSSVLSANLGATNASGNFTTTLNPVGYNVTVGVPTYVMVDGARSQSINWPNFSTQNSGTTGYITLSQSNLNLTVGQGASITISSSITNYGSLSIPSNTNPNVASVSVSGNQIVVNGLTIGSTNITVCAVNAGCVTLFVNVQQSSTNQGGQTTSPGTISFSQSNVNMAIGQSRTVSLSGPGSFYVSLNSNLAAVSTNVNGSILTINALQSGSAILSVCSAGNGSTSCGAVNVTIASSGNVANSTIASTTVYASPNNLTLSIGQTQTVALTSSQNGSETYYVGSNANSGIAVVNVSGNNALVSASSYGGTNVTICAVGVNNCANLYVFVSQGASGSASAVTTVTTPLALTSFSISSNNVNSAFMAAGDALTFTFNANQSISMPTVTINGSQIAVYGSNAGPYTVIYAMTGTESLPLTISLNIANAGGASVRQVFTIGNSSSIAASAMPSVTTASCPNGYTCVAQPGISGSTTTAVPSASAGPYSFNRYLYAGMMKLGESDPDVYALQQRLKADGVYAGPITGYFGIQTQAAVEAFQKKHGLTALGVIGPSTRALLNQGI